MKPIPTLIVDDEPAARAALVELLQRDVEIAVVGECAGGRQAVNLVREHEPELMFLDIQMPGMNGFGVIGEIEPDRLPVVVFVTAYDKHALQAFEVHAVDYLLKPFSDARFVEALNAAKNQVRQRRLAALDHTVAARASSKPEPAHGGQQESARAKGDGTHHLAQLSVSVAGRLAWVPTGDIDWSHAARD